MAEIKAFVAHSFSADDKELIAIFCEHFDTLASSLPGFSWDHAQQAEPTSISEKVLTKIEDKNVLIAICTQSEYVVSPKFANSFPFTDLIRINKNNLQWKTSDWVIQEIGLAIGRSMKIIIFLEENVRRPGGLPGGVEYISFSRKTPHKSFDKLLQMLGTINPKEQAFVTVSDDKSSVPNQVKKADEFEKGIEPQSDWDQTRYDRAILWAIMIRHDVSAFEVIDTAYRASSFGRGIALVIWEARIEFLRMLGEQRFDFEKIRRATRDNPQNSELLYFLASGFREFGDYSAAARTFEEAAANAKEESKKIGYLTNAASQYALAGRWNQSSKIIEGLKSDIAEDPELQYTLLSELCKLAEREKNDQLHIAIMEHMADLRPDDTSVRFSLAFKHSEVGNNDMSLYHYLMIPISQRDSATWNNIGVAYGNFQMPIKSVDAFRVAKDDNNTLAMSNLGFNLLRSGFLPEARQEADNAISIKPYHKNIPELIKRLSEVEDEEERKLTETLEKTRDKANFYRRCGEGVLKATPHEVQPRWNSPEGTLEGKMEGTSIRFSGAYEKPSTPFTGLLSKAFGGHEEMVTHRIEYLGQVRGNVITGNVKRSRDGEVPSLLGSGMDNLKMIMVFNDDHTEISIMENPDGVHPSFYTITCSP